jgi:hypothetical protein
MAGDLARPGHGPGGFADFPPSPKQTTAKKLHDVVPDMAKL